jgi:HEAT repeat protein
VISLLAVVALAARDDVADLIAKLRAAGDVSARYQWTNALSMAVKPQHLPLLLKETDAGPAAIRPLLIRLVAEAGGKDAAPGLRTLCQKFEIASRAEAAYSLMTLEDESGMKILSALLPKAETDDDKRAILNHLWGGYLGETAEAVSALTAFLEREKRLDLRRQAVRAIASYRKDPAVLPTLRKIAAGEDQNLRTEALAELVRRGDDEALEEALKTLEEGKAGAIVAFTLLSAIEWNNKKAVLPRLRAVLETCSDKNVRAALIRTLANLKDDKSLALLTKLSEDPEEGVARAAVEAVIKLAGKGQLELLKKACLEGDGQRRVEAAEALLQLDRPEGFEGIKGVLETGKSFERLRAVMALGRMRRKESIDLLLDIIDDKDETVRTQARQGINAVLTALFPYLRFEANPAADKLRAWWLKNRPK